MGYIQDDFNDLKKNLNSMIGEEVLIVQPVSKRGKKLGKLGKIENTYNDYFRVKFEDENFVNYNYVDLLTKDIKMQTFDGSNFNSFKVRRPLTKKETVPSLDMSRFDHLSISEDNIVNPEDL